MSSRYNLYIHCLFCLINFVIFLFWYTLPSSKEYMEKVDVRIVYIIKSWITWFARRTDWPIEKRWNNLFYICSSPFQHKILLECSIPPLVVLETLVVVSYFITQHETFNKIVLFYVIIIIDFSIVVKKNDIIHWLLSK